MNNLVYLDQCFSSQCGLCSFCTDAMHPTPTKQDPKPDCPEMDYSKIIEKFMKPGINEMTEQYMNKVYIRNNRELRDDFRDGHERYYGIIPDRYIVDESRFQESVYIRQKTPHTLICDMPLCKAMYHSLPEYTQTSKYPHFPVYVREKRKNVKQDVSCTLCYECISRFGEAQK
jgi:hypothetical protein